MAMDLGVEIVVINDSAAFNGGASNVALQSAIGLADRGLSVTAFTAVGPVAPEIQNRARLNVICTEQHEIADDPNRFRAFVQGIWNRKAVAELAKLLSTKDPSTNDCARARVDEGSVACCACPCLGSGISGYANGT